MQLGQTCGFDKNTLCYFRLMETFTVSLKKLLIFNEVILNTVSKKKEVCVHHIFIHNFDFLKSVNKVFHEISTALKYSLEPSFYKIKML